MKGYITKYKPTLNDLEDNTASKRELYKKEENGHTKAKNKNKTKNQSNYNIISDHSIPMVGKPVSKFGLSRVFGPPPLNTLSVMVQ